MACLMVIVLWRKIKHRRKKKWLTKQKDYFKHDSEKTVMLSDIWGDTWNMWDYKLCRYQPNAYSRLCRKSTQVSDRNVALPRNRKKLYMTGMEWDSGEKTAGLRILVPPTNHIRSLWMILSREMYFSALENEYIWRPWDTWGSSRQIIHTHLQDFTETCEVTRLIKQLRWFATVGMVESMLSCATWQLLLLIKYPEISSVFS